MQRVRVLSCTNGYPHHEGHTGHVRPGKHDLEPGTVLVELDGPIDIVFGTSTAGYCVASATETIEGMEVDPAKTRPDQPTSKTPELSECLHVSWRPCSLRPPPRS